MTDEIEYCWHCNDFCRVHFGPDLPTCSQCDGDELDPHACCVLCGGDVFYSDNYEQHGTGLAHDGCIASELERAKRDADEYAADCEFDRRRDALLERADMARLMAKDR